MEDCKEKINEEYLCVLKKDIKSKSIIIDYEKIKNPHSLHLVNIENLCKDEKTDIEDIFIHISKIRHIFTFKEFPKYCSYLNGIFQDHYFDIDWTINYFREKKEKVIKYQASNYSNALQEIKKELFSKIKSWFKSVLLGETYQKLREDNSVIVYSHRIPGWTFPEYKLHKNFSFQIKTNFGYGQSSFFYTKLKYKGVDIVPFSDWVKYEYAKLYEIIDYSANHFVSNKSWYESFNYVLNAYNLFLNNEEEFVQKYIINECKNLNNTLRKILNNDSGNIPLIKGKTYFNSEKKIINFQYDKFNLICFKGERISGSLELLDKIKSFQTVILTEIFIKNIEELNNQILVILRNEKEKIELEINNFLKLQNQKNKYQEKKYKLEKSFLKKKVKNIHELSEVINNKFLELYPEYPQFLNKIKEIEKEYWNIEAKINSLKDMQKNIQNSINKVEEYFKLKNLVI